MPDSLPPHRIVPEICALQNTRITRLEADLASALRGMSRLEAQGEAQGREIGELKESLKGVSDRLDKLLEMANQSRGALWAGIGLVGAAGAVAGWIGTHLLSR